jgi:hypothetical protein
MHASDPVETRKDGRAAFLGMGVGLVWIAVVAGVSFLIAQSTLPEDHAAPATPGAAGGAPAAQH